MSVDARLSSVILYHCFRPAMAMILHEIPRITDDLSDAQYLGLLAHH